MKIDVSAFEAALISLKEALSLYAEKSGESEILAKALRDSVIQRFEYSYEFSWKLLKRFVEDIIGKDAADRLNRRELFRHGHETGLIDNPSDWFVYNDARNETSHAYDVVKAEHVFSVIPDFLAKAEILLQRMKEKQ